MLKTMTTDCECFNFFVALFNSMHLTSLKTKFSSYFQIDKKDSLVMSTKYFSSVLMITAYIIFMTTLTNNLRTSNSKSFFGKQQRLNLKKISMQHLIT